MTALNNIEIELTIRIGEAALPLKRLLRMRRGGLIMLGGDERRQLDILANGRRIAAGRVVLRGDEVAVRIEQRRRGTAL